VMAERLAGLVAAEPAGLVVGPVAARIRALLALRAGTARSELVAGLNSPRYTTLLKDIDALVFRAAQPDRIPRRRLMRLAGKALERADARLDDATRPPKKPKKRKKAAARPGTDERLHEARKAYKRARYAAELVTPLAGDRAERLSERLTELQDVLGTHQDALVTCDLLRDYAERAHEAGESSFTYGVLHVRAFEHGRRCLDDLPKASRRARKAGKKLYR
jgi:CHAD domain-containing protein